MANLIEKVMAWWRRLLGIFVDQAPAAEAEIVEQAAPEPYRYREHRTYTKRDEGLWRRLGHAKFKRQGIARRQQRQAQSG